MTIPDYQLALSARLLRRSFAFACVASLLLGSSTQAGTILNFGQTNPLDVVTATSSGGVITLSTAGNVDGGGTSIPVTITNLLGAPTPGLPAFETFVGVTNGGGATFSGKIEYTSLPGGAGVDYLTATFTAATISGATGGSAGSIMAGSPTLTFASGLASLDGTTGMAVAFSNVSPGLGTFPWTAQTAGGFSATIVPEPGTLCLASIAAAIGTLAYGRKRMKIEG